ncbi:MAG: hypothetical protein ABJN40_07840 [Sneathiella sp.]
MASLTEIIWSLFGCYRLAVRDKNALDFFNISASGFWISFSAILLALPVLALENTLEHNAIGTDVDMLPYLLVRVVGTVASWGIYLTFIALFDQFYSRTGRFGAFVIVYNWAQFALILIWFPISILTMGLMGPEATSLFALIFMGLSYVYLWYIIVTSMEVSGPVAAMLAFSEFIIALSVHRTTLEIFYT